MRTDAYDRFCTRLEQRFTRRQIEQMLSDAGFDGIRFSDSGPLLVRGWQKTLKNAGLAWGRAPPNRQP
jgi:hypothetical protein